MVESPNDEKGAQKHLKTTDSSDGAFNDAEKQIFGLPAEVPVDGHLEMSPQGLSPL